MKARKTTIWITTTAVFIALLIGAQYVTAPFGQFVTGSAVNLILIIAVMTRGMASGLTVALVSPVFANLIGIGPFWPIVPFMMAGNTTLVLLWHIISRVKTANRHIIRVAAAIAAAAGKFAALYLGVVHVAVPLLLPELIENFSEPQAAMMSSMFSVPQLFTALIGGALAIAVLPVLEKAGVMGRG